SAYGSQADRKTTRFSTQLSALGGGLELAQDLVAAAHGVVERALCVLAPGEHRFHLLLDHFAALYEVAEAQALGVLRRRLVRELLDGDERTRLLRVVAGFARQLEGREGDRHVAGADVPVHLHFGTGKEGEEFRHALVLGRLLAAHHPERGAADDRVLRRAFDVVVIRQEVRRPLELGRFLDARLGARAAGEKRAFAARELGVALVGAPGIGELALLGELAEHRDMANVQRRIDAELRIEAGHAVLLGADRHVVPGAEVLDVHPRRPGRGVHALLPAALQLVGDRAEFL